MLENALSNKVQVGGRRAKLDGLAVTHGVERRLGKAQVNAKPRNLLPSSASHGLRLHCCALRLPVDARADEQPLLQTNNERGCASQHRHLLRERLLAGDTRTTPQTTPNYPQTTPRGPSRAQTGAKQAQTGSEVSLSLVGVYTRTLLLPSTCPVGALWDPPFFAHLPKCKHP